MSWLSKLFGASDTVKAAGEAFDNLFTSDEERDQAKTVLEKLRQQPAIMQAEINKVEAQHRSVFVAGWRPGIGWVCAISLAMFYIPQFALAAVVWVLTVAESGWTIIPAYPGSADSLMELVLALLGMATIRTVEKAKGLTR